MQVRIAAFSASNLVRVEVEGEEVRRGAEDSGEECGEEEDGEDAASFEWKHLNCRLEMFDEVK
jgi:hypothetical protein